VSHIAACVGPEHFRPVAREHPHAPVPFQDDPEPVAHLPDLTAKEAAHRLAMVDKNGKPTDAFFKLAPTIGYQVGGRGDWRIRREALDHLRGVVS
jgi:hypothetical protein